MATLLNETRTVDVPALEPVRPAPPRPSPKPVRLASLDAYRGFIMLAMASGGLALGTVYRNAFLQEPSIITSTLVQSGGLQNLWQPGWVAATTLQPPQDPEPWRFLAFHTDHVAWVGCSFWDLIQPSFMFMVGVALPYSYASRRARGDKHSRIFLHTIWRSLLLILLAIFLSSGPRTNFVFTNVLAQIGLGYVFLFLLVGRGLAVQTAMLVAILGGYVLFFGLFPIPGADWFAHWNKDVNAANWFDQWFLNLFPRQTPFTSERGGYQTLNFVPSLATMLLGLMAGEFLRKPGTHAWRFLVLVLAGVVCLGLGMLMGEYVCPLVKRIWTPSWAIYSAGWTFLMLAFFYGVIDGLNLRGWAFPFVVVGMNSIAMYCMAQLLKPWVGSRLKMHLEPTWFTGTYGPIIEQCAILLVLWLVCLWMYRRGLFLKI